MRPANASPRLSKAITAITALVSVAVMHCTTPDKSNTSSFHCHLEVKDDKGAFNPIEGILEVKPDQKFRLSTKSNTIFGQIR